MIGRAKQWAEQQLEAARKDVLELGPEVKQTQKEGMIFLGFGLVCFLISLPLGAPRSYVMLGAGWLFFMGHSVWTLRGAKKKAEYDHARWSVQLYELALQLAYTIAYEEQLLQAGEPVEGGTDGSASI